jgi:hypothetical protein
MSRTITIPSTSVTEAVNGIVETPGQSVRVVIGLLDANGNWLLNQNMQTYIINGDDYVELNGPPTTWATDKPTGTYRNDDLWHYVDKQRLANSSKSS